MLEIGDLWPFCVKCLKRPKQKGERYCGKCFAEQRINSKVKS